MLLSLIAILFVFGVIVIVHEWGHMMAAKSCGVAVPDFAIGMGPSLWSFRMGDTKYHICAFPLGGFVRIAGLEGDDALPTTKRELDMIRRDAAEVPADIAQGDIVDTAAEGRERVIEHAAGTTPDGSPKVGRWRTWRDINGWQKAFILVGGPAMNFLLALLIIFAMGMIGFPKDAVLISAVESGSPAEEAGLKAGDLVMKVAGERAANSRQFSAVVHAYKDKTLPIVVQREGRLVEIEAQPRVIEGYNSGKVSLGVGLADQGFMTTEIGLVAPKSVADQDLATASGDKLRLRVGDRIMAVDGKPVNQGLDLYEMLAPFDMQTGKVTEPAAQDFLLTIQRGNETHEVTIPADTTILTLGVQLKPELQRLPLAEGFRRSLQDAKAYMIGMVWGLRMLFTSEGAKAISGPVGIVRMIGQSAGSDLHTFLFVFMLINLNLGLMNLLPVPAFDGGRLVFVALNGIGLRINAKREAMVHAMGMVLLISMMLLVTFTDVVAWL